MTLTNDQKLIYDKCNTELTLHTAKLGDEYYYNSLPLCVIDAVYSIGVRYTSTRNTVIRYCNNTHIHRLSKPLGNFSDAHTINDLIENISPYTDTDYGASENELFGNNQKTSTKNGILKSKAVFMFAKVLAANGIQTISDIRNTSFTCLDTIEAQIRKIAGQKSGISFSYFLMLSGDDEHMKIDRWLLRFVGDALHIKKFSNVSKAQNDLLAVCDELKKTYPNLTARLLDHTIWSYMKK